MAVVRDDRTMGVGSDVGLGSKVREEFGNATHMGMLKKTLAELRWGFLVIRPREELV